MIKLYKKDQPDHLTTWRWIVQNSDQEEQQQKVSENIKHHKIIYDFTHNFDLDQLGNDIEEAKALYGEHGWSSNNSKDGKDSPTEDSALLGILIKNPLQMNIKVY